jgi:hypothetical protein
VIAAAVASVALSVSPARVALEPRTPTVLRVSGPNVSVTVRAVGYGLDLRGRQRVLRASAPWLSVSPRRVVATRTGTPVTLRAKLPRAARGDLFAVVLVTATSGSRVGVAVRVRLGVVASVRAPGKVTHRIVVRGLRLRGHVFELMLANMGDVAETLHPADVTVAVGRARLHPRARQLLPHSKALLALSWRGVPTARLVARVRVRQLVRALVCKSPSWQGRHHRWCV